MKKSKYTAGAIRRALELKLGNITHAAEYLGTTKTHGMRLVKKFGLNSYASEIRLSSGGSLTGKPPAVFVEQRR